MKNLIWLKFNRWLILEMLWANKWWQMLVKCKCDCWTEKVITYNSLRTKHNPSKSCWCLNIKNITKHWMCYTKINKVFQWMCERCRNKNSYWYRLYWGRWIQVLWKDFIEFYQDMWSTYKEWLTIDRIDNNWHYCKENCRRITNKEQQNNKNNNHLLTFNWITLNTKQRSYKLWIKYDTIKSRIRYWYPIEKILSIDKQYKYL